MNDDMMNEIRTDKDLIDFFKAEMKREKIDENIYYDEDYISIINSITAIASYGITTEKYDVLLRIYRQAGNIIR